MSNKHGASFQEIFPEADPAKQFLEPVNETIINQEIVPLTGQNSTIGSVDFFNSTKRPNGFFEKALPRDARRADPYARDYPSAETSSGRDLAKYYLNRRLR